ncbi:hypothetical protein OPT61_g4734 [Boeremia exigua]|uniref:Uncharacterized protein n=1 Tax=Boeremia exigua TaxID=749465 RepID=A0ACC2ID05_9PLEO|nr:hypothetical protein OPT61_g4734 [Boeremia exigua]
MCVPFSAHPTVLCVPIISDTPDKKTRLAPCSLTVGGLHRPSAQFHCVAQCSDKFWKWTKVVRPVQDKASTLCRSEVTSTHNRNQTLRKYHQPIVKPEPHRRIYSKHLSGRQYLDMAHQVHQVSRGYDLANTHDAFGGAMPAPPSTPLESEVLVISENHRDIATELIKRLLHIAQAAHNASKNGCTGGKVRFEQT